LTRQSSLVTAQGATVRHSQPLGVQRIASHTLVSGSVLACSAELAKVGGPGEKAS
jgi:hypothetical protein